MITDTQLYDLLRRHQIDAERERVYLMRHRDQAYPLINYVGSALLTLYQARQAMALEVGGWIVAFYGHTPGHALLLGIWRIRAVIPAAHAVAQGLLDDSFEPPAERNQGFYHELEELTLLAAYQRRLEVRWGGAAISWRRVLRSGNDYPIRLCDPPVPFSGVENASLIMAELRIALQDLAWQKGLASVCGVYLIYDGDSKQHYVGAAYGKEGILQRWAEYARNGHGDTVELKRILTAFPNRVYGFRITLLESFPRSRGDTHILEREGYWKIALGSRTIGLNRN